MPVPIHATLNDAVKDTVQIENFIYHIIKKDAEEPDYNDAVQLNDEQKRFFESRIRIACAGTQFCFVSENNNSCQSDCNQIIADVDANLAAVSGDLAARFLGAHNRSMSEGVFIVTVFSVLINNERQKLIAFLKVDYSTVYQQNRQEVSQGHHVVTLTRVMESLSDSPQSLQKWAVIDPTDLFAWDVLASQRKTGAAEKDTNEAISVYFRNFLQVAVMQTASVLTKSSVSSVRQWAQSLDDLPQDMSRSDFRARAIHYFENNENFDTEGFVNQVIGSYTSDDLTEEENQSRLALREHHIARLTDALAADGIAGQTFACKPSSIPNRVRTTKLTTTSGLTLTYQGTQEENNITVDYEGQEQVITIRTTQLVEE